jgi:hypothetical protein
MSVEHSMSIPPEAWQMKLNIFLLIGQSNMAGRGRPGEVTGLKVGDDCRLSDPNNYGLKQGGIGP